MNGKSFTKEEASGRIFALSKSPDGLLMLNAYMEMHRAGTVTGSIVIRSSAQIDTLHTLPAVNASIVKETTTLMTKVRLCLHIL